MTERIKKLNELHDRALQKVEEHGFNCTVMLCPGAGKTFLSFKIMYRMLELGLIQKHDKIIYNAETVTREKVLFNNDPDNLGEIHKFKNIYGKDVLADFDFRFHCYQAKPDEIYRNFEKVGLVINDEAHDMLTETRHTVLTKSKCKYNICLTGAMSMEANVFPTRLPEEVGYMAQSDLATKEGKVTDFITKGQMLQIHCPVAIKYPTSKAIEEGIIAEFKSYVIKHQLNNTSITELIWKTKEKRGTEKMFWDQKYHFAAGPNSWTKPANVKVGILRNQLPNFLYDLKSKDDVVRAILYRLQGQKTVVFGERIATLQRILGEKAVVTSTNESELVDKFNKGEVKVIGSSKLIKQGSNLNGVQNIIFHSYTSKWHDYEQRRARVRWLNGDQAKLFFIVTENTFEDTRYKGSKSTPGWFDKMKLEKSATNKLIKKHDFNIVATINSSTLVNWYKNQT